MPTHDARRDQQLRRPKREAGCLAVLGLMLLAASAPQARGEEAPEAGFVALFDGSSLKGWDGNPELWSVVDGVIRGKTSADAPIKQNTFLIWGGRADDFVLRLEFRVADWGIGNSGVQYRSKRFTDAGRWVIGGYQADIERTNTHMGILYEERGRGILAKRGQAVELMPGGKRSKKRVAGSVGDPSEIVEGVRAGEWQTLEVIARGRSLEHKLNGRTTIKVTDNDEANAAKSGLIGLQLHRGPPMQIDFRNIRLKEAPRGE
ncbi:MAG: DUF1080 domain-containing protein [Planctomycetota bacterium]